MPFPRPRKADFPTVDDLPDLECYDAARILSVLWRLCHAQVAEVYTRPYAPQDERPRWNVWLEITQRRVELATWAREWLASQELEEEGSDSPEGGDAA